MPVYLLPLGDILPPCRVNGCMQAKTRRLALPPALTTLTLQKCFKPSESRCAFSQSIGFACSWEGKGATGNNVSCRCCITASAVALQPAQPVF